MATGDAAEWLRHAESDLTYARLGEVPAGDFAKSGCFSRGTSQCPDAIRCRGKISRGHRADQTRGIGFGDCNGRESRWVGAGPDTRRPWHTVNPGPIGVVPPRSQCPFWPVFNVDSNKCSNKKQDNPKCLKHRILQANTIAL